MSPSTGSYYGKLPLALAWIPGSVQGTLHSREGPHTGQEQTVSAAVGRLRSMHCHFYSMHGGEAVNAVAEQRVDSKHHLGTRPGNALQKETKQDR